MQAVERDDFKTLDRVIRGIGSGVAVNQALHRACTLNRRRLMIRIFQEPGLEYIAVLCNGCRPRATRLLTSSREAMMVLYSPSFHAQSRLPASVVDHIHSFIHPFPPATIHAIGEYIQRLRRSQ